MAAAASGCVLSFSQLFKLLIGLSYEGKCDFFSRDAAAKQYRSPRFRREYCDILTSLVLFGGAKLSLSCNPELPAAAEVLEREGLLRALPVNDMKDFQAKVVNTYRLLYDKCRSLEENPATAPLRYIDDPAVRHPSKMSRIDALCDEDDIDFYCRELRDKVVPLITGIHDIFGHYFAELSNDNAGFVSGTAAIRSMMSGADRDDGFGTMWRPGLDADTDTYHFDTLFRDMGICVRDGATLANIRGETVYPGYYRPDDLAGISEMNHYLFGHINVNEYDQAHVLINMRPDPEHFLQIHSFWQTFFEIVSMLKLAEKTHSALFIPSTARIRIRRTNSAELGTSAELVRIYRIYLAESGMLPTPTTFEEALRLRDDKNLNSLRSSLVRWLSSYSEIAEEPELVASVRKEIAAAKSVASRLDKYARVASIVGYVTLPISIAEAATGRSFGSLALAPVGPAIDTYRILRLRKFGWLNFGK